MGFDEVRVRYRNQRRSLIGDIILKQMKAPLTNEFIYSQANKIIPEKDRDLFIEDLFQDLHEIDASRIAGLGVTLEELNRWKFIQ